MTAAIAGSKRLIITLSVLLVAQIGLATFLKLGQKKYQALEPSKPLVNCDFNKVTKMVIEESPTKDRPATKVVLEKKGQRWFIPEYFNFPASDRKIKRLFDNLQQIKVGIPMATSSGSAERFKVSQTNHERVINLFEDDKQVGTLYLGSSPSYKTTYVKMPGSENVYAADGVKIYEVTGTASDWILRELPGFVATKVSSIDMGTFKITHAGNNWTIVGPGKTWPLNETGAQRFFNLVAKIPISGVLSTKPEAEFGHDSGAPPSFKVSFEGGETLSYTFSKPPGKGHNYHVLKISDKPWYMTVFDFTVNRISTLSPEVVLKNQIEGEKKKQSAKDQILEQFKAKGIPVKTR